MHQQSDRALLCSDVSDEVLVRQTLAGDQRAFETLVRRYDTRLLQFIRSCLRKYDDDRAYDILQHVLLQLYRSLPKLATAPQPLKAWLFRVAYNRCVDELRRSRGKQIYQFSQLESEDEENGSLLTLMEDTQLLPEERAEQHDLRREIQAAIEGLPLRYRSIVLLRCVYDMSFPEIGQRLKMPDTTAKTYFHRARPLLRAALATL